MKGGKVMDNSTLREHLNLMLSGDKNAFVRVYEELKKPVFTVIFRIVSSKESAEDITQEFFIKIFKDPPKADIKNPRAWIFTVARNMAIDHLRREHHSDSLDIDIAYQTDLEMNIDLERTISTLGMEEREIITLHLNCDLTFLEISKIMKVSLPSVYRRYQKAIKSLKKQLQGGYYG